ncbi:MAG: monomeric [FeFe] hydrogenase [Halothermotrichaceae bacterium]
MTQILSEVTKIRRKVLAEVASLLFKDRLVEEIESIPVKITEEGISRYRCCKYKERAILKERIKLVLGADLSLVDKEKRLSEVAEEALTGKFDNLESSFISIIEEACDHCSIDKIFVTNACRNCVAHSCVNTCPRDAVKIVNNKAFINQEQCIECGLCVQACHYGAIMEIERPCSRACSVEAVVPGDKATASINSEDCVECGACIVACPFGAVSFRSDVTRVIRMLKDDSMEVNALVAPSYIGQFGKRVDWNILKKGLEKMGFSSVHMVAEGADLVIEEEAEELQEKIDNKEGIMFNSCCPSFKQLVKKYYPELSSNISKTESPMIKTARIYKSNIAENSREKSVRCVFIGPCLAKKNEAAAQEDNILDSVLTYEELTAMFVAAEINLAKLKNQNQSSSNGDKVKNDGMKISRDNSSQQLPSISAVNFCAAGGVGAAIRKGSPDREIKVQKADGISSCRQLLNRVKKEAVDADFIEGMGCQGGCIGGPGTLTKPGTARAILKRNTSHIY